MWRSMMRHMRASQMRTEPNLCQQVVETATEITDEFNWNLYWQWKIQGYYWRQRSHAFNWHSFSLSCAYFPFIHGFIQFSIDWMNEFQLLLLTLARKNAYRPKTRNSFSWKTTTRSTCVSSLCISIVFIGFFKLTRFSIRLFAQ